MQLNYNTFTKNLIQFIFLIASVLMFNHCASIKSSIAPSKEVPADTSKTWDQREQELQKINNWTNRGAISVQAPDTKGSASINWQQTANNYNVRIFGPLGAGTTLLDGSQEQVTLTTSKGEKFSAASAEQLLAEQSGWYLPISSLKYWIRGIPAPDIPSEKQLDASQRLQKLTQQGWTIQYTDYRSVGDVDLPRRIDLTDGKIKARIVINRWSI